MAKKAKPAAPAAPATTDSAQPLFLIKQHGARPGDPPQYVICQKIGDLQTDHGLVKSGEVDAYLDRHAETHKAAPFPQVNLRAAWVGPTDPNHGQGRP